ncbi:histidine kinase [Nostoc edaphicum CCNP1411]|uniref:Histidine kinase n=1 Tax=Nostoc edaphicum CCNP1411 TaxID=1472755 RepID=A0A7D7LIC6_9NOSO|nr:histidine kinase [Nostoc edaphicum]QMS91571.1 histidine kinase [Nostoc edaphicum CCNP1411]
MPNSQCPMPHAQSPMPHAQYPMPNPQFFNLCLLTSLLSGQSLRRSVRSLSF